MNNLTFQQKPSSFSFFARQTPRSCPGNCLSQIDAPFWLANQTYWVYKCACCGARKIEKGQDHHA